MIILDGKRFWVTYATLNISLLLIFSAIAFTNYSLLAGYTIGMVSFLFFLLSLKLILKLLNSTKTNKINVEKKLKRKSGFFFFIAFLISFLSLILNIGLFTLFIWINYLYTKNYHVSSNIAFFPFNTIAMTSPYLLLSGYIIIWGFIALIKTKNKKKGE
ncbi:hypothetical protein BCF89_1099 [Metamycoplasma auris]|uniref:Uncharacterized protein n=1 Tax=Metamycoplasma auris TaxID=51363 RepID=A0A2W7G2E8_9BACT|nr:hypothetical protein BCF89_1099 [Metamycoplasma auris]